MLEGTEGFAKGKIIDHLESRKIIKAHVHNDLYGHLIRVEAIHCAEKMMDEIKRL